MKSIRQVIATANPVWLSAAAGLIAAGITLLILSATAVR